MSVCFQFEQLPLVVTIYRFLYRAYVVQQCTVALASISCDDAGWLGAYEVSRFQLLYILVYGIGTHLHCFADGLVAGVALVGPPVLDMQQVTVDRDRSSR